MLDFLKNAVKSKAFKELLRVLVALAAGYAGSGCSGAALQAPNSAQIAVYECQLAALADAVPPEVAQDVVMAARAGQVHYVVGQLAAFGLDLPRIEAFVEAFNACLGESVAPADVGTLIRS